MNNKEKKVAIVHDFLLYPGGAEKVLMEIMDMYPDAPIYTLLYNKEKMQEIVGDREVRTSFLQTWPSWLRKRHRLLLPFYGSAVEALDLREFDLVISSSGAWTKGLVTRLDTKHVAYIHSPMRYVWDENERYLARVAPKRGFFARQILSYLRVWDHQAAQRPDMLIANSQYTQKRISKYYRRKSTVIYPPVVVPPKMTHVNQTRKGFLVISRLSAYKNVKLAHDVCDKLHLPLTVIGDGPEMGALTQHSSEYVTYKGWVSEKEKWEILQASRALLFPCEDDFGIVCVEALAAGTPIIALGQGGAQEIIRDGIDGILFDAAIESVMADGVRRFIENENSFDVERMRERAQQFRTDQFREALRDAVYNSSQETL